MPDGYDGRMDPEVISLCDAMNEMSGIRTVESCCGHDRDNFLIWFYADSLESLPELLYWLDGCHSGFYGWRVTVKTDCAMSPATFLVEGPQGAYHQADAIAKIIHDSATKS